VSTARVAAIDIGTNSVLLLIAEPRGGALQAVVERATVTRLGQDVDARRALAPEAARRTLSCLESYARELRAFGVQRVAAVGTSALRDAAGGAEFLDQAEALLGVRPRVISGDEEAELTFHGSLSGLTRPAGAVCVFDIGGGSTEIIRGRSADGASSVVEHAVSLDVGSVRLFERHLRHDPPLLEEMARVDADVGRALAAAGAAASDAVLVGVAGTVTTLVAIELGLSSYDSARVHGFTLTRAAVEALATRLSALSLAQRIELAGLEPQRADVIVVGAAIVRSILAWSGRAELVVSDRGVRWGLAERLSNSA
jgi:exopolyphosphatase / guanosine-5'-triphosphate,3'-diphosphate pyrophosphatase